MRLLRLLSQRGVYSEDRERAYYAQSAKDAAAKSYDHLDQYIQGSVGLDFFSGKAVLDIGCGEGEYSAWIADRGRARRVVGVELTEHRIRREFETRLPNLQFRCGNIFAMEINEAFDVVFFNLVLHHLRFNLLPVFQLAKRVLNPGGALVAIEPNPRSPLGLIGFALHAKSENEGVLWPSTANSALREAGFSDVRVGYMWRNRQWARHSLIGTSYWLVAR